jgi:hypothetical protein
VKALRGVPDKFCGDKRYSFLNSTGHGPRVDEVSMRRHITILLASERVSTNLDRWTPAFRVVLCYEEIYKEPRGPFYAQDKDLIFTTQAEANQFAEDAAREWCVQHYPGWTTSH